MRDNMSPSRRRALGIITTGSISVLAGCLSFGERPSDSTSSQSTNTASPTDSPTAEQTETNTASPTDSPTAEQTETNTAEQTETSGPSVDDLSLEPGLLEGETHLVNNSSVRVPMAYVILPENAVEDFSDRRFPLFGIPPGETRGFGETGAEIGSAYFENKDYVTDMPVETTTPPSAATPSSLPGDGGYTYQIPNETGIKDEDIRQVTLSVPGAGSVQAGRGGKDNTVFSTPFSFQWTKGAEVTISGVTKKEKFSWRAASAPNPSISVSGSVFDSLEISFTAQSRTPVVSPVVYTSITGPSTDQALDYGYNVYRPKKPASASSKALISDSVSKSRVGKSRKLSFGSILSDRNVNFPLEKSDKLIVGVAVDHPVGFGFPVTSTTVPLSNVV